MTTTRHFLNALKRDGRQLATPTRGTWQAEDAFLQKYSADIDLQGQVEGIQLSHSVPSFFQRPIQFYHSLVDPKNPLHRAVQSEWRGLLAAFALARWLDISITVEEFAVEPAARDEESHVGATGNGDLHFRTILNNQLPSEHWRKWWLIRCDGTLLGATSPWIIAYTAAQYKAPRSIPWQNDTGLLIDPIDHFDPKRDQSCQELAILEAWVRGTLENREAWRFADGLGPQENVVAEALETWMEDLAAYRDSSLQLQDYSTAFHSDHYLGGILRHVEGLTGQESDLFIRSTKPQEKVLVFSENLPKEKRVYRGIFADQVDVESLADEGSGFVTKSGKAVSYHYIVAERLFLPPRLVQLKLAADTAMEKMAGLAMPLTPDFFRFFDHADVENRLSITRMGDGYRVTLQVPVNKGSLKIEKTYLESDILRLDRKSGDAGHILGTPAFGLWPDFYDEAWTENFAAYVATADRNEDELCVRPIFSDGSDPGATAKSGVNQKDLRIWACPRPCIGFALEIEDRNMERTFKVGLVLLKKLNTLPAPESVRSWQVGVDFGTSSTTVMLTASAGAQPEALNFQGRTVFLSVPEDSQQLTGIENNLYPRKGTIITPPFRTLLYEAAATIFASEPAHYTVRFTARAADDTAIKPVANVKWGQQSGQGAESPLTAYLQGLVRYIVCEARHAAVSQLKFRWSYPLSLPAGAYTKMESFWSQQVNQRYSGIGSMDVRVAAKGISESEAVCRCLAKKDTLKIHAGGLAIAVDVGGGSADVAMWSAKTLKDQFSFKLAGNDLFDPSYLTESTVKALIEACNKTKVDDVALQNIMTNPHIYVNGALTEVKDGKGNPIRDPHVHPLPLFIHGRNEDVPPWKQFRSMIYLYFTGLAYYLGTHTRTIEVDLNKIEIFLGGRGSSGLTWLAANGDLLREVLGDAFQLGLQSQIKSDDQDVPAKYQYVKNANVEFLGDPIDFQPDYPPLKTEVATGLLYDLEVTVDTAEGVYIGEVGWHYKGSEKSEQPWGKKVDAKFMAQLEPPQQLESCHIADFITWLREDKKKFLKRLNLDENLKKIWPDRADIQNMIRKAADGDDHVLQPLFGYELQALMRQYGKLAADAIRSKTAVA
jgi:hypothetical protein